MSSLSSLRFSGYFGTLPIHFPLNKIFVPFTQSVYHFLRDPSLLHALLHRTFEFTFKKMFDLFNYHIGHFLRDPLLTLLAHFKTSINNFTIWEVSRCTAAPGIIFG